MFVVIIILFYSFVFVILSIIVCKLFVFSNLVILYLDKKFIKKLVFLFERVLELFLFKFFVFLNCYKNLCNLRIFLKNFGYLYVVWL